MTKAYRGYIQKTNYGWNIVVKDDKGNTVAQPIAITAKELPLYVGTRNSVEGGLLGRVQKENYVSGDRIGISLTSEEVLRAGAKAPNNLKPSFMLVAQNMQADSTKATQKKVISKQQAGILPKAGTTVSQKELDEDFEGSPQSWSFWNNYASSQREAIELAAKAEGMRMHGLWTLPDAIKHMGLEGQEDKTKKQKYPRTNAGGADMTPGFEDPYTTAIKKGDTAEGQTAAEKTGDLGTPKTTGKMVNIYIKKGSTFGDADIEISSEGGGSVSFTVTDGDFWSSSALLDALIEAIEEPINPESDNIAGTIDINTVLSTVRSNLDDIKGNARGTLQELSKFAKGLPQDSNEFVDSNDSNKSDKSDKSDESSSSNSPPRTTYKKGDPAETMDPYKDYYLGRRAGIDRYSRSLMDDNYTRRIKIGDRAVSNANANFGKRRGLGYSANTGAYNLLNRIGITDVKREDVLRNKARKKLNKANQAGEEYQNTRDILQREKDTYDQQMAQAGSDENYNLSKGPLAMRDSFELRRLNRRMNRMEKKQGRKMNKFRTKVGRADNLVRKERGRLADQMNRYASNKERGTIEGML